MTPRTCCRRPADVFATTPWSAVGVMQRPRHTRRAAEPCNADGSACAHWGSRNAARGLTTPSHPPGSLMAMNDIGRPPLFTTSAAASPTPTALSVQSRPRRVADVPGTASERGIRLTWRRLDRLSSAVTLGVILASPRSALLIDRTLGPRIPPLAPARVRVTPVTPRRGSVR